MIPISACRLRHRRIRCTDGDLLDVTLFPFFDRAGGVSVVLAIDHLRARLQLLRMDRTAIKARWLGRIQCDGPRSTFCELTRGNITALTRLWHFDPKWMLSQPPFGMHWATPMLKDTNCANLLTVKHRAMYFRRDLSTIRGILISEKGELKFRDWNPENLPEQKTTRRAIRLRSPATKTALRRGPTWRLDPIWLH